MNVKDIENKKYTEYPERILQFGQGNFLRGFVDWMIDLSNEKGKLKSRVVLTQPIEKEKTEEINRQNGQYTLVMRGRENGEAKEETRIIHSVSRGINPFENYEQYYNFIISDDLKVVVSNTTEAGIVYGVGDKFEDKLPKSFPAKITKLLYIRYKHFLGNLEKGLLFLPVELIDNNGSELKRLVLRYAREWDLGNDFIDWINKANHFTNTLVDRIVTGYPRENIKEFEEKLGYKDDLLVTSELFNLWVIEGDKSWAKYFPIEGVGANVIWTGDVAPYKKRKVRILNGGHTSTVPAAYLAGHEIVREFMEDEVFKNYLEELLLEEVIPTIDMEKEDLLAFSKSVEDRFLNPYIRHKLLDITLNSISKFKARCLCSLLDYYNINNELPERLVFSLAALIRFYKTEKRENKFFGVDEIGRQYAVRDNLDILEFFCETWNEEDLSKVANKVLSNVDFWGQDLTKINGLEDKVIADLESIMKNGIKETIKKL